MMLAFMWLFSQLRPDCAHNEGIALGTSPAALESLLLAYLNEQMPSRKVSKERAATSIRAHQAYLKKYPLRSTRECLNFTGGTVRTLVGGVSDIAPCKSIGHRCSPTMLYTPAITGLGVGSP